jgi:hypothetical protein
MFSNSLLSAAGMFLKGTTAGKTTADKMKVLLQNRDWGNIKVKYV